MEPMIPALFRFFNDLQIINSTYSIKNNCVNFFININSEYNLSVEAYVWDLNETYSPSIIKNISINENSNEFYLNFTFNNLTPNNYECVFNQRDNYECVLLKIPFVITNYSETEYSNNQNKNDTLNMTINSTYNDSIVNMSISGNNNSHSGLSNNGSLNNTNQQITNKNQNNSVKDKIKSVGNNNIKSKNNDDSSKYYELSEKNVSKSINNIWINLGLIIILFISLLIGYIKFKFNIRI